MSLLNRREIRCLLDGVDINRTHNGAPVGLRDWLVLSLVEAGATPGQVASLERRDVAWRGRLAVVSLRIGECGMSTIELYPVPSCRLSRWLNETQDAGGSLFGLGNGQAVLNLIARNRLAS